MLDGNIAFIGGGAMAEAIVKGLLAQEVATPTQLMASDPVAARRDYLQTEYGIHTTADNAEAVRAADVIVLAVKPQVFERVAEGLRDQLSSEALAISIMAGVTMATIQRGLGHERVVRTMPNTPAQINMGVTAWLADGSVSDEQRAQTQTILGALGEQIPVEKEEYIDMQTGLGGSGPGFVFLIIEALIDAGVQMGFSRADAQTVVLQTLAGSVELMRQTGEHPAVLRNRVTSAGGTTAAGLAELERGNLRTTLTNGVLAAYRRSAELGRAESRDSGA